MPSATAHELAALGLELSDFDDHEEVVWYWPDTRQAVELFARLRTQWRVGMNGATGLDYAALYPLMDRLQLASDQWDALLTDIQCMEVEALDAMHPDTDPKAG